MVSGQGEGKIAAGRRGAAAESSRPLKETLLLLPLLLSEVLLILEHLGRAKSYTDEDEDEEKTPHTELHRYQRDLI